MPSGGGVVGEHANQLDFDSFDALGVETRVAPVELVEVCFDREEARGAEGVELRGEVGSDGYDVLDAAALAGLGGNGLVSEGIDIGKEAVASEQDGVAAGRGGGERDTP